MIFNCFLILMPIKFTRYINLFEVMQYAQLRRFVVRNKTTKAVDYKHTKQFIYFS